MADDTRHYGCFGLLLFGALLAAIAVVVVLLAVTVIRMHLLN